MIIFNPDLEYFLDYNDFVSYNDRNTHKYDNMHGNEIVYALIYINNHVL